MSEFPFPYEPALSANVMHRDDEAVASFVGAMCLKLAHRRHEGREGWEDRDQCSAEFLSQLLREHVEKGDPVEVANFAMMLHQRGERIATAMQIAAWEDLEANRHG
ncbi:MAG: hypothetical protein P0Y65_20610 [Candidatus Devosia phytovorans]|uniref:Uncharacterized protein n=1 Tax=Candidatus Devosia phytovorans TaxID=3121372 RepID=A0AAJ5VV96_9HYPH|nr:hypothetical protein [Devosia sp.]WEK04545.1 MAG: hypothetical protein P0Y65_20610 [Devosia sp.]